MVVLLLVTIPDQKAVAKFAERPKKTEFVQYATGPGAETNPEVLGERVVKTRTPDSDGVEALKTAGAFVIDFISLPLQIVKVLWESVIE